MAGFHSTASDTWLHDRAKTSRTSLHFILARVEIRIENISRGIPGGYSIFFRIVGSDPASTAHPPKISGISSTPKIFEILATQKISQFCTFTFKKDPKMLRNDPQTSPIL